MADASETYAKRGGVNDKHPEQGYSFRLEVDGVDQCDQQQPRQDWFEVTAFCVREWIGIATRGELKLTYRRDHLGNKPVPEVGEMKGRKVRLILVGFADKKRWFWGELQRFRAIDESDPHFIRYRCALRLPYDKLLHRRHHAYHRGTTPRIARHLLEKTSGCTGLNAEGPLVEFRLKQEGKDYPQRAICVQAGDPTALFIAHLCEYEGIAMVYDHQKDGVSGAALYFIDHLRGFPTVEPGELEVAQPIEGQAPPPGPGLIENMSQVAADGPTEFSTSTFNPQSEQGWSEEGGELRHVDDEVGLGLQEEEVYDTIDEQDQEGGPKGADSELMRRIAEVRRDELIGRQQCYEGLATSYYIAPGYRFELKGALAGVPEGEYLVISAEHCVKSRKARYQCHFMAVRTEGLGSFRPPRITPRNSISGRVTLAKVVGLEGQDTHEPLQSERGRIWVKPLDDREGGLTAQDGFSVPLLTPTAAPGGGFSFRPTVHEVVACCFTGSSNSGDKLPICMGAVRTAANPMPTDNPSQMGIRLPSQPIALRNEDPNTPNCLELRLGCNERGEQLYVQSPNMIDLAAHGNTTFYSGENYVQQTDCQPQGSNGQGPGGHYQWTKGGHVLKVNGLLRISCEQFVFEGGPAMMFTQSGGDKQISVLGSLHEMGQKGYKCTTPTGVHIGATPPGGQPKVELPDFPEEGLQLPHEIGEHCRGGTPSPDAPPKGNPNVRLGCGRDE